MAVRIVPPNIQKGPERTVIEINIDNFVLEFIAVDIDSSDCTVCSDVPGVKNVLFVISSCDHNVRFILSVADNAVDMVLDIVLRTEIVIEIRSLRNIVLLLDLSISINTLCKNEIDVLNINGMSVLVNSTELDVIVRCFKTADNELCGLVSRKVYVEL